jgi:uncharacterized protein
MKKSIFNVNFYVDGNEYIFNTKTNALIQVEECDFNNSDSLSYMLNNGFLVEDNTDELINLRKEVRERLNSDFDDLNLTIMITEECNFNCIYCYQKHNSRTLDITKANSILKITESILRKKSYKKILIQYFGGEPLLYVDCIMFLHRKFIEIAAEFKIDYQPYLTTNGSLLNTEIVNLINFENIQITLDGLEDNHNILRKSDAFRFSELIEITDSILPLIKSLNIRINLCEENKNDLIPLIDFIMSRYSIFKNKINFTMNQMVKYKDNATFSMLTYEQYARLNLQGRLKLQSYGKELLLPKRINYNCPFIYNKALCINPDLQISYCSGSDVLRDIEFCDKIIEDIPEFEINAKCKKCRILPLCLGGCRIKHELNQTNCIPEKLIIEDLLINHIMQKQKHQNY